MGLQPTPAVARTKRPWAFIFWQVAAGLLVAFGVCTALLCLYYAGGQVRGGMAGILRTIVLDADLLDTEGWTIIKTGGLEGLSRWMILMQGYGFLLSLGFVAVGTVGIWPHPSRGRLWVALGLGILLLPLIWVYGLVVVASWPRLLALALILIAYFAGAVLCLRRKTK